MAGCCRGFMQMNLGFLLLLLVGGGEYGGRLMTTAEVARSSLPRPLADPTKCPRLLIQGACSPDTCKKQCAEKEPNSIGSVCIFTSWHFDCYCLFYVC